MRALLLAGVVLAASLALACAAPFDVNHIGVLNQRLTLEQRQTRSLPDIEPQWFTQTLDHNDLASKETFQQLYYTNTTFFNPEKPVFFLMIGGEGPIAPAYVTDHFHMGALSAKARAMQLVLEHRFYGQSVPANDSSTANLQRFLSSDQALADLVTFRRYIMDSMGLSDAKWVVFGGSYSGSLSAWARLKYPQLFVGSIASSAPLQAKLDFTEYFEVVAKSVGPTTAALLSNVTAEVLEQLSTYDGKLRLVDHFNLCEAPQTDADAANLLSTLTNPIAETVQYDDDNIRLRQWDITTIQTLMASMEDPYQAFLMLWQSYNTFTNNTNCTDISYTNSVQQMQQGSSAGRSWTWQTCTEFGYYQTAESPAQPFSSLISLQWYLQQCADVFGMPLSPKISYINDFYGADDIVTSHTAFTNGDVDPWHALGTYETFPVDSMATSILISGTAHCADLYSPQPEDLPGLTAARELQENLLFEWLAAADEAAEKNTTPRYMTA